MKLIYYLPIEHIFNLLSVFRRGETTNAETVRVALKRRGLQSLTEGQGEGIRKIPRLSFWLRLCQAASLLDEAPAPYPTLLVEEWLSWPFLRQFSHLLEAWLQVPDRDKYRRTRRELLKRLVERVELGASHRQDLVGLQVLRICEGERLSALGMALLEDSGKEQFGGLLTKRWRLENDRIEVPFPPAWELLWELERYLDPAAPGIYLLNTPALRLAVQRGALGRTISQSSPSLPDILERGLGESPPDHLIERLASEPAIRVIPGPVLEFTHPEELKALRGSPGLRRELERLLSPRHVALDPWRAHRILRRMWRQGLISERDLEQTGGLYPPSPALTIQASDIGRSSPTLTKRLRRNELRDHLNKSARVYLLSLMLLAEGLQNVAAPPPGLLTRLTENLDHALRAAAARKATAMLEQIKPRLPWKLEEEQSRDLYDPPMPSEELIMAIQGAIDREESIDVLYKASGRHSAEYRHLSPLIVEPRGERFYLIAYCHTRRANRTFRLDRLKLIDFPPL